MVGLRLREWRAGPWLGMSYWLMALHLKGNMRSGEHLFPFYWFPPFWPLRSINHLVNQGPSIEALFSLAYLGPLVEPFTCPSASGESHLLVDRDATSFKDQPRLYMASCAGSAVQNQVHNCQNQPHGHVNCYTPRQSQITGSTFKC